MSGSRGRPRINHEQMPARFPAGTFERMDATGYQRSSIIRFGVELALAVISEHQAKTALSRKLEQVLAKAGFRPLMPDLSAPTHDPWREEIAELLALVKRGDLEGLKAFDPNKHKPDRKVVTSTPKRLIRYRNNAIAALEAGTVD